MTEISCREVEALLAAAEDLLLVDCREPAEHAIAALPQAKLLPMSELPGRVSELEADRQRKIVVLCHHGMRSAQVTAWLTDQGFESVSSMAGGIDRWSEEIDSSIPRY